MQAGLPFASATSCITGRISRPHQHQRWLLCVPYRKVHGTARRGDKRPRRWKALTRPLRLHGSMDYLSNLLTTGLENVKHRNTIIFGRKVITNRLSKLFIAGFAAYQSRKWKHETTIIFGRKAFMNTICEQRNLVATMTMHSVHVTLGWLSLTIAAVEIRFRSGSELSPTVLLTMQRFRSECCS